MPEREMTEEWFDVVDDEDVVTGRATRRARCSSG